MSFASLGLTESLEKAAAGLGFATATPVQTQAIPPILDGKDVWACAPTGSGKTAAYVLPLLDIATRQAQSARDTEHQRNQRRTTQTLVVVPTRELAQQVGQLYKALCSTLAYAPKVVVAYGGVSINPQLMTMRGGADVLIATPGRLLDLANHNAAHLGQVQHLVLDEADRLLDLGFSEELARVLDLLPARRQNLFFSATFPQAVQALAEQLLHHPVRVEINATEATPAPEIAQRAIIIDSTQRTPLLRNLLKTQEWERVLVFVATKYTAEHVANKLYQSGVYATAFHGELSQGARQTVLQEFKDKRWQVLVTTDLAARGIDIAQLPAVVNYDLPRATADYIHRIGRTGRAGESGEAISMVTPAALAHWALIEKREQLLVPLEELEDFPVTEAVPLLADTSGNGGIKGKRPSKKDKLRAAAQQADGETPQ